MITVDDLFIVTDRLYDIRRYMIHRHTTEEQLIESLRVYRDILFQFKDRFRWRDRYQNAVDCMCAVLDTLRPTLSAEFVAVKDLRCREVTRRRWRLLHASARLLALYYRAVVTANHPSRKRSRNEFDVLE